MQVHEVDALLKRLNDRFPNMTKSQHFRSICAAALEATPPAVAARYAIDNLSAVTKGTPARPMFTTSLLGLRDG